MEDRIILSRPNYSLECHAEAQLIFFYSKQRTSREIRIEGKLESVWESPESHKLIIFVSETLPRVYDPKNHSLTKIRNPNGSSYRILGEDLLIGIEDQNLMIWIKKSQEYRLLTESSNAYEADSYSIVRDKNGQSSIRIDNTYYPMTPEDTMLVYPKPKENDAAEIKAETPDLPNISRIKEFPLEELLAKAPESNYNLAVSPDKKYAIQYSKLTSELTLWMAKNGMMQLRDTLDRHACSLRSACFLGRDDYFASLDSVGTLKIWCLDEDLMTCCQTMHVPEFEHAQEHHSICYELDNKCLACHHKEGIDYYSLHLETYKPKRKNQLLSYLNSKGKDPKKETSQNQTADYRKTPEEKTSNEGIKLPENIKPKNEEQAPKAHRVTIQLSNPAKPKNRRSQYQYRESLSLGYQLSKTSAERKADKPSSMNTTNSKFVKRSIGVTVGIDFGTSRTKISYRTARDQTAHILHFDHLRQDYYDDVYENWTIPSVVSERDGQFSFGYQALSETQGILHQNLKTSLFKRTVSTKDQAVCAAFIAYLFETCKKQIMHEQGITENYEFVYSVCLPVEQMNDNLVVDNMHRVLTLAEVIAENNCYTDANTVMSFETELSTDAVLQYSQIIPESAAEIQDYHLRLQSAGYYLLFDFGAGTTDMTLFHLHTVFPRKGDMLGAKIVYKGFSDIEDKLLNVKDPSEIIKSHYQNIFNDFKYSDIWEQAKSKRKGIESMMPFYNMIVLASGGASKNTIILDIFNQSPLRDYTPNIRRPPIEVLRDPPLWPGERAPYYRCAVAYGLSGDPDEIKRRYILPKDCKTLENRPKIKIYTEDEIAENNRNWLG